MHARFKAGDLNLQSGEVLPAAQLAYKTYGSLNAAKDNAVLLPTFYTGTHERNEGFFGPGRAIDTSRYFVVSINLFGNGHSSSPSNAPTPYGGRDFPRVTLYDNVACQQRLLEELFGIEQLALVAGWSMAGCQAYQWAAQFPERVRAILPFCASAKTSPHNFVFLEGVKAALQADAGWNDGAYQAPPERGLRAFARVYAGWAFSQSFYRESLYKSLGFDSIEDLLLDWEEDHVRNWDANDLLAKLWAWQQCDISANALYRGDLPRALAAIEACAILIACSDDLYFPPADNEIEARHMPNAELRIFESPWGHCVASPGNEPRFTRFLDAAITELLQT